MRPQAIAKLRRTFIIVAMASFIVVIAFMGTATYASTIITMRGQANATIDAIVDAGGNVPTKENYNGRYFPEEASYGLRFFTITYDDEGNVKDVDVSHVALIDEESAVAAASVASSPGIISHLQKYGTYFYKEEEFQDGSMVVFLDCSFQMENARETTVHTLALSIIAVLVTLACVVHFSRRAIQPEVENARRQQQFMTNASHELKTPISVIRANTEVTEMISGESEWTQSTLAQVDRLDELVSDLMTIVRGEETSSSQKEITVFDASEIIEEAVDSFKSRAQQKGIGLESSIEKGVKIRGNEASIEQLCCLLVDNATKYCDESGTVEVRLAPALLGRGFTLAVSNDYANGSDVDYQRFFERFYREDESHENQQGYGIGLSVAQSICERYHGTIKASWKSGRITFTCILKDA